MTGMQATFKNEFKMLKSNKWYLCGAVAFFVAAFGVLSYQGYSWYRRQQEQAAQNAFSEALEEYSRISYEYLKKSDISREGFVNRWRDLDERLVLLAKKYSSSVLCPFMIAMRADLAVNQQQYKEAAGFIDEALKHMSPAMTGYTQLRVKAALARVDSGDEALL